MGRRHDAAQSFQSDANTVFGQLTVAMEKAGVPPSSADPANLRVSGAKSLSLFSWGEKVTAHVAPAEHGCTVAVESKLVLGLFDWGRNKKNVDDILANLSQLVS